MSTIRHRCPICRRTVDPTIRNKICGHFDTAGHVCPASFETFDITLTETRPDGGPQQ